MIAPDPKTVREIAREFLLDDDLTADDLGYAVRRHTGYGMPAEEFQAWRNAVDADVEEATVTKVASWPDEQQPEFECEVCTKPITAYPCVLCEHEPDPWKKPDEQQPADVVTAEQQQDGAVEDGAVEDVTAFLDAWEADRGFGNAIRGGNGDMPYLFATDLRAVLAERTALAARVAELESERDDDLCILAAFLLPNRRPIEEWLCILANHFEARTNALMRDADRFAAARFRVDRVPTATETEES